MIAPHFSLHGVSIGYPRRPILLNVTLNIFPGDSFAVFGPNGSGKTAFLKTIAGILKPIQGTLSGNADLNGKATQVGYVPQRAAVSGLLPLTVREVVQMGTYGTLKPWQGLGLRNRERIDQAMEEVEINTIEKKLYSELSGGQQQRVLIARALATNPDVLLLDEPLASLDQNTVRAMLVLLNRLKSGTALTLLWADHFVPDLLKIVQEVLVIDHEEVVRTSVDAFLERHHGFPELTL